MTTRSIVTALVALMLVWGAPASAQQAKCLAGKTKCMSKKAGGLLKCEATAETPGKPTDTTSCRNKVVGKFDGGVDPAKGCFAKLENKSGNDCITTGDTGPAEDAVDSCVASFVEAIDPGATDQTKCGAGKKKCVSKYLKALLKCRALSQTPGKSTDPNANGCVDKAQAKYNGGADPTKGCFAKLEAKNGNDCMTPTGNSGPVQGLVENCDDNLAAVVTSASTSTTTTTTLPGILLHGALAPPTLGRFNYNSTIGIPAVNAACLSQFPSATLHPCTYAELQTAQANGDLVGLKDTQNTAVTSFWAIDNAQPPLSQCQDDNAGGSLQNWEYGTAHTASRGQKVALNNGAGTLGSLQSGEFCSIFGTVSWVGCCQ